MAHCHCTMCRKAHGTAYATFVTFAADRFRWVRGEAGIRRYESSPGSFRAFCGRCGAKLPAREPFAYAHAAPLVGELGVRPSAHMFAPAKAPWHTITDTLEQLETFPGGGGTPLPTPRHTEPAAGKIRGSCLCGAAAYEIDGPLHGGGIISCHCSRCRAGRAAMHGSNFVVPPELFRWLRGADVVATWKVPDAARYTQSFCTICGSILPYPKDSPRRMIPAGTLDDDPGVREAFHIFVGSRAPWEEIPGDQPQFAEYPPGDFSAPVARRA
jgi:hypothetical protein